jgi:putative membrane protein
VATIFLIPIVMLVVVKNNMSLFYGLAGLFLLIVLLMAAIKIYKRIRESKA